MSTENALAEAVEVLQQLGLKEYEAKCFVGLSRMSTGTAKQLSEVTDVPRTRVYDAIRVLEAQGLVEVQHSSPQRFRAVPLPEAVETLRDQYEDRIDRLTDALERVDSVQPDDEESVQNVWAMSGKNAIENRTHQLVDDAVDEVMLVVGDESLLTADLVEELTTVPDGVDLLVGAVTESLQESIQDAIPQARTFVSGLEWLRDEDGTDDLAIGRLLLVDRTDFLVSTIDPDTGEEHAVFGSGFRNGIVVIARRLLSQGLLAARDPSQERSRP